MNRKCNSYSFEFTRMKKLKHEKEILIQYSYYVFNAPVMEKVIRIMQSTILAPVYVVEFLLTTFKFCLLAPVEILGIALENKIL